MKNFSDRRIDIFIIILIFMLLGTACAQSEIHMDVVLVIDNSGSMDWRGHDPKGDRFEGARLFIDKSEEGDKVALIDFSGTSELILPLTRVTEARKSTMKSIAFTVRSERQLTDIDSALRLALQELSSKRAEPGHTPVVILLTDGEIDVIEGTSEQKQLEAKRSEEVLFSETIPRYEQNYIPIYTVALKSGMETSVLEKIAKKTKLKKQINEQHYFQVEPGTELIGIFSVILSQIKKQSSVTRKYHFTGEPIHQKTDTTSLTKEMNVDVLLGHKKNMRVALKGPNGQIVQPSSQGDKYNRYQVDNPAPGQWDVSIEGEGENEVIIATFVESEIKIDLPFASRFKLDEDIPIFANIIYKNKIIEDSVFKIEVDGEKYPCEIKKFLLSIQKPNGRKSGPFPLKREGGSYTYFYKDADMVGTYIFDFELRANFMKRDLSLSTQKKVYVFKAVGSPTILFKKLKEEYSIGDTVLIEFSVTKNARLIQNPSISVEVSSPQGNEIVSVPRKGLKKYSLAFTQTDEKGEYVFTAPETEEYQVIGSQQSITIVTPFAFPWKILSAGLTILAIIGLIAVGKIKGWYPWGKRKAKIKETSEEESGQTEDIRKRKYYPIPDEILIWSNYALAGHMNMTERKESEEELSYYFEYFGKSNVILNNTAIKGASGVVNGGDTVKLDELEFKINVPEVGEAAAVISNSEDIRIKLSEESDVIKWYVIPAASQPPQEGNVIFPTFMRGKVIHIGQNVKSQKRLS